jgi:hypothetical protein
MSLTDNGRMVIEVQSQNTFTGKIFDDLFYPEGAVVAGTVGFSVPGVASTWGALTFTTIPAAANSPEESRPTAQLSSDGSGALSAFIWGLVGTIEGDRVSCLFLNLPPG